MGNDEYIENLINEVVEKMKANEYYLHKDEYRSKYHKENKAEDHLKEEVRRLRFMLALTLNLVLCNPQDDALLEHISSNYTKLVSQEEIVRAGNTLHDMQQV